MLRIPLMVLLVTLLSSCSSSGNRANDNLYSAFEDDFFEGLDDSEITSNKNTDIGEQTGSFAEGNQSSDGDGESAINEGGEGAVTITDNFAGDNYIFSFTVGEGESLKSRMQDLLEPYGYKLIWQSNYEIYFENDVLYEDKLLVNVLKSISADLSSMGIDIHINVYLKNKVVLVYSVRS